MSSVAWMENGRASGSSGAGSRFWEGLLVVGAPLALAAVEVFHPHPHEGDLFDLNMNVWLPIHYAQIVLFPLVALAVAGLARGGAGRTAARVCAVAMFIFGVTYVAFDTSAGVVTGILVKAGRASGAPEDWLPAVMTVWNHPVIGGGGGSPPVLAIAGTVAWLVGAVAAAVSLRRAGGSWVAVLLVAISGVGLLAFRSHSYPGGPLTFGTMGVGAAWFRWGGLLTGVRGVVLAPP